MMVMGRKKKMMMGWREMVMCVVVCVSVILFSVQQADAHGGVHHEEEHEEDLRAKGLILVKVYCLIIVFVATFVGGISPYFLRWNHSFLLLGTQFAGGVFLATALIHFLADSASTFQERTSNPYAFAEMLAVAGFLLTMLGDVVIQHVYSHSRSSHVSSTKPDVEEAPVAAAVPEAKAIILSTSTTTVGDAVLLILALCFHSVFEGIAIGIAETKSNAWKALWTISLHKVFAAIAMGIALLRMLPNRPLLSCALYAFAFAISTPIGVAIGIIIDSTTEGPTADWVYAISMGLACGVFIYVAINHLLAKGYIPPHPVAADRPFLKFLAVLLGAALIAIVMIWDA
ncbi:unnamed protein product [Sphagnum troendelagicum]|uniref:Zinc/iron permease n=1 Tax=Sphagnum troendelagicum TaxID=128251 RepID=A0ABP0US57_9BRYO